MPVSTVYLEEGDKVGGRGDSVTGNKLGNVTGRKEISLGVG